MEALKNAVKETMRFDLTVRETDKMEVSIAIVLDEKELRRKMAKYIDVEENEMLLD